MSRKYRLIANFSYLFSFGQMMRFFCKAGFRKGLRLLLLVVFLLFFFLNILLIFSFKLPSFQLQASSSSLLPDSPRRSNEAPSKVPSLVPSRTTSKASFPVDCKTWCRRGEGLQPPYHLTAVLLVRVYRRDPAGLTSREMLQWLYYLRYAGFEHVFVYDAYVTKNESQYDVLAALIQSGYVTYEDWSSHNPYSIKDTQIAAYQDCVDKYGKNVTWQVAIDIDEYLFSPVDLEPNFMQRFLRNYSQKHPDISQITLQNYLFLGKPLDHRANPLLIDRIMRRTHEPANGLGKSIYRSSDIQLAQVHHNDMRSGRSVDCDSKLLRMNHYWGARLQNWGGDTPDILEKTEPDYSIQPIAHRINRCSNCLGADGMYTRRWNWTKEVCNWKSWIHSVEFLTGKKHMEMFDFKVK